MSMKTKKVNDIDLLLSKLDRKQLSEFIKKECANDVRFLNRFLALGTGIVFKANPDDYTTRVLDLIEDYEGRYGYVEYRDTFDFNRAVCRILDEADDAMKNHQWSVAMTVLQGVAAAGEDIINCGDDSAGNLGAIVWSCFEKWHNLCHEEALPEELKTEIFELSITRFSEKDLEGWDWWWDWIKMAISLADTHEKQERVIAALDDVIHTKGDEWSVKYNVQTAQKYKLEIMSKVGTPEDQREFMYENVANPTFREKLLQMAWDEGNYDEVLRLAKEGVSHDSERSGLVNDWHQWELKTYLHRNDKENTLQLARYFFFAPCRFGKEEYTMEKMYALMKSIVPSEDWNDYVNTLIDEAYGKKDSVKLLYIYTKEKKWDRYMDFLRKNPSVYALDDAPQEVWTLNKEELIRLYDSCVRHFFQQTSNRDSYREGVGLLRKLIKYGGKTEADNIIAEQKARTPRRPALIDELSKL